VRNLEIIEASQGIVSKTRSCSIYGAGALGALRLARGAFEADSGVREKWNGGAAE
jgi:hypothetical protein